MLQSSVEKATLLKRLAPRVAIQSKPESFKTEGLRLIHVPSFAGATIYMKK